MPALPPGEDDRSLVFVIDPDPVSRDAVARLLQAHGLRTAASHAAEDVLPRLPSGLAACVVTEVRLAGQSGLDLQDAARDTAPDVAFVFLTGHAHVPDVVRALKAGAVDFLPKPPDAVALADAVQRALARSAAACTRRAAVTDATSRLALLSPREREVCRHVGRGLLNKQIAAELGTSEKTVKTQRGRALKKLGVSSTAALVDLLRLAGE